MAADDLVTLVVLDFETFIEEYDISNQLDKT